ncbi:MAG: sigma-70 family RNA polymerase sigma factor [Planctomycetota bacterium]
MPRPPFSDADLEMHSKWMRSLARGLVADAHLRDDVVQAAWASVLDHPPSPGRAARPWITTIIRNLIKRWHRDRTRRERRELYTARNEALPPADEVAERISTQRALMEAVARLDEPYRTTIILRFYDQLPPREIAKRFSVPVATVRTRIARAIERLRLDLDTTFGGDRRAWMIALLPFLNTPPFGAAVPLGIAIMKLKIAAAAVLLAAVFVTVWFLTNNRPSEKIDKIADVASNSPEAGREAGEGSVNITKAMAPGRALLEAAENINLTKDAKETRPSTTPAPRFVRGYVINLDSRRVAGLDIRMEGHAEKVATSDSDGSFIFQIPKETGASALRRVEVASANYISVLAGTVLQQSSQTSPVIVVAPKISVAGFVNDESGAPIEGARIQFHFPAGFRANFREVLDASIDGAWTADSDARGYFEFKEFPAVEGAALETQRAGFVTTKEESPRVSLFKMNIVLKRAEYKESLSGVVLDMLQNPVAGARVSAGQDLIVTTDDAGKFSLLAGDESEITVMAVKTGVIPAIEKVKSQLQNGRTVWPNPCILRLGESALSLEGTVVNDRGAPVAGASVWIMNATWFGLDHGVPRVLESTVAGFGTAPMVESDANGKFTIKGLLRQNYQLKAVDPDSLREGMLDSTAGYTSVKITIPGGGLYERVAGTVVGFDGKPVAGVTVQPFRAAFSITMPGHGRYRRSCATNSIVTDENGKFEFKNIARDGVGISAYGALVVPSSIETLSEPVDSLQIKVSRRCHLKIELQDSKDPANKFKVLNGAGEQLEINIFNGESTYGDITADLNNGLSEPVAVEETAKTLVLMKGKEELRRMPLLLKPGELTVVRP